jgi:hypothetical protein
MKKNFFKFLLLGAFTLSLGAGFVGCQDYTADIDDLQKQINELKSQDSKAVADVALNGSKLTVTYTDGTTKDITLPAGTTSSTIELKDNTLYVDGVAKGTVDFAGGLDASVFGVSDDGYLTVGGEKTSVLLANGSIQFLKDDNDNLLAVYVVSDEEKYIIPVYNALTDLRFMPDMYVGGIPALAFNRIVRTTYASVADSVKAAAARGLILESETTANFRLYPANANVKPVTNWSYFNRAVTILTEYTRSTDLEKNNFLSIVGGNAGVTAKGGYVTMKVKANHAASLDSLDKKDIVVLEAKLDGGKANETAVTSDEVQVFLKDYYNVAILNSKTAFVATSPVENMYPNDLTLAKNASYAPTHKVDNTKNGQPNTFNLNDYVVAATDITDTYAFQPLGYGVVPSADFENLALLNIPTSYKFSSVPYTATDATDQATFVTLDPATGIVTTKGTTSAENRTPLFKADLLAADGVTVIATHYIKFQIVKEVATAPTVTVDLGDIPYKDLYISTAPFRTKGLTWQQVNHEIYDVLGMSHADFLAAYTVPSATAIVYDHAGQGATGTAPVNADGKFDDLGVMGTAAFTAGSEDVNSSTAALTLSIDAKTRFGAHEWTTEFVPANPAANSPVKVIFKFNLVAPAVPVLDKPYYVDAQDIATVKGRIPAGASIFELTAVMSESFLSSSLDAFVANVVDSIVLNNATQDDNTQTHLMSFGYDNAGLAKMTDYPIGTTVAQQVPGVLGTITDAVQPKGFLTQVISTAQMEDVDRIYNVNFRSTYANGGYREVNWKYKFINPLTVTLSEFIMPTTDLPTIDSLAQHVSVKVNDANVYINGIPQPVPVPMAPVGTNNTIYSVDAINAMTWEVVNVGEDASKLFLGVGDPDNGTAPAVATPGNYYTLVWNNHGDELLTDRTTETVKLTVATPYAKRTVTGNITLKAKGAQ